MSREIEFRAWDVKNKRFVNIVRFIFDQFGALDYAEVVFKGKMYKLYPSEIVLEQDTGLKDKNGKKIYEGDIVKWNDCIMKVVWENDFASFELVYPDNSIEEGMFANEYMRNWGVVGTIHENPELFGGEE